MIMSYCLEVPRPLTQALSDAFPDAVHAQVGHHGYILNAVPSLPQRVRTWIAIGRTWLGSMRKGVACQM